MSTPEISYWRSVDGGPWEQCEVGPRSVVGWHLTRLSAGEVYDDGCGYHYKWERGQ